ncbi:MAG: hypothetical protein AAGN15_10405 [Cyanobacteria bacterium J06581_3]
MTSKSTSTKDIEDIARQAQAGIDVSEHFTGQYQAKQRNDVTFPLELLRNIDEDCRQRNISRQDWILEACTEKLHSIKASE